MEIRTIQKLGLLCASVVLCSAASWWNGNAETEQQVQKLAEQPAVAEVQEIKITVCISGAVVKPGLYQVTKGCRAQQVIELAGGVTDEADMDKVNLAQLCKDGGHIKVPRLSKARLKKLAAEKNARTSINGSTEKLGNHSGATYEDIGSNAGQGTGTKETVVATNPERKYYPGNKKPGEVQISLNSASEAELTQLPGVGVATARRIVAFRNQHRFQSIEDIMIIPGIGPAKFAKMKAYLIL